MFRNKDHQQRRLHELHYSSFSVGAWTGRNGTTLSNDVILLGLSKHGELLVCGTTINTDVVTSGMPENADLDIPESPANLTRVFSHVRGYANCTVQGILGVGRNPGQRQNTVPGFLKMTEIISRGTRGSSDNGNSVVPRIAGCDSEVVISQMSGQDNIAMLKTSGTADKNVGTIRRVTCTVVLWKRGQEELHEQQRFDFWAVLFGMFRTAGVKLSEQSGSPFPMIHAFVRPTLVHVYLTDIQGIQMHSDIQVCMYSLKVDTLSLPESVCSDGFVKESSLVTYLLTILTLARASMCFEYHVQNVVAENRNNNSSFKERQFKRKVNTSIFSHSTQTEQARNEKHIVRRKHFRVVGFSLCKLRRSKKTWRLHRRPRISFHPHWELTSEMRREPTFQSSIKARLPVQRSTDSGRAVCHLKNFEQIVSSAGEDVLSCWNNNSRYGINSSEPFDVEPFTNSAHMFEPCNSVLKRFHKESDFTADSKFSHLGLGADLKDRRENRLHRPKPWKHYIYKSSDLTEKGRNFISRTPSSMNKSQNGAVYSIWNSHGSQADHSSLSISNRDKQETESFGIDATGGLPSDWDFILGSEKIDHVNSSHNEEDQSPARNPFLQNKTCDMEMLEKRQMKKKTVGLKSSAQVENSKSSQVPMEADYAVRYRRRPSERAKVFSLSKRRKEKAGRKANIVAGLEKRVQTIVQSYMNFLEQELKQTTASHDDKEKERQPFSSCKKNMHLCVKLKSEKLEKNTEKNVLGFGNVGLQASSSTYLVSPSQRCVALGQSQDSDDRLSTGTYTLTARGWDPDPDPLYLKESRKKSRIPLPLRYLGTRAADMTASDKTSHWPSMEPDVYLKPPQGMAKKQQEKAKPRKQFNRFPETCSPILDNVNNVCTKSSYSEKLKPSPALGTTLSSCNDVMSSVGNKVRIPQPRTTTFLEGAKRCRRTKGLSQHLDPTLISSNKTGVFGCADPGFLSNETCEGLIARPSHFSARPLKDRGDSCNDNSSCSVQSPPVSFHRMNDSEHAAAGHIRQETMGTVRRELASVKKQEVNNASLASVDITTPASPVHKPGDLALKKSLCRSSPDKFGKCTRTNYTEIFQARGQTRAKSGKAPQNLDLEKDTPFVTQKVTLRAGKSKIITSRAQLQKIFHTPSTFLSAQSKTFMELEDETCPDSLNFREMTESPVNTRREDTKQCMPPCTASFHSTNGYKSVSVGHEGFIQLTDLSLEKNKSKKIQTVNTNQKQTKVSAETEKVDFFSPVVPLFNELHELVLKEDTPAENKKGDVLPALDNLHVKPTVCKSVHSETYQRKGDNDRSKDKHRTARTTRIPAESRGDCGIDEELKCKKTTTPVLDTESSLVAFGDMLLTGANWVDTEGYKSNVGITQKSTVHVPKTSVKVDPWLYTCSANACTLPCVSFKGPGILTGSASEKEEKLRNGSDADTSTSSWHSTTSYNKPKAAQGYSLDRERGTSLPAPIASVEQTMLAQKRCAVTEKPDSGGQVTAPDDTANMYFGEIKNHRSIGQESSSCTMKSIPELPYNGPSQVSIIQPDSCHESPTVCSCEDDSCSRTQCTNMVSLCSHGPLKARMRRAYSESHLLSISKSSSSYEQQTTFDVYSLPSSSPSNDISARHWDTKHSKEAPKLVTHTFGDKARNQQPREKRGDWPVLRPKVSSMGGNMSHNRTPSKLPLLSFLHRIKQSPWSDAKENRIRRAHCNEVILAPHHHKRSKKRNYPRRNTNSEGDESRQGQLTSRISSQDADSSTSHPYFKRLLTFWESQTRPGKKGQTKDMTEASYRDAVEFDTYTSQLNRNTARGCLASVQSSTQSTSYYSIEQRDLSSCSKKLTRNKMKKKLNMCSTKTRLSSHNVQKHCHRTHRGKFLIRVRKDKIPGILVSPEMCLEPPGTRHKRAWPTTAASEYDRELESGRSSSSHVRVDELSFSALSTLDRNPKSNEDPANRNSVGLLKQNGAANKHTGTDLNVTARPTSSHDQPASSRTWYYSHQPMTYSSDLQNLPGHIMEPDKTLERMTQTKYQLIMSFLHSLHDPTVDERDITVTSRSNQGGVVKYDNSVLEEESKSLPLATRATGSTDCEESFLRNETAVTTKNGLGGSCEYSLNKDFKSTLFLKPQKTIEIDQHQSGKGRGLKIAPAHDKISQSVTRSKIKYQVPKLEVGESPSSSLSRRGDPVVAFTSAPSANFHVFEMSPKTSNTSLVQSSNNLQNLKTDDSIKKRNSFERSKCQNPLKKSPSLVRNLKSQTNFSATNSTSISNCLDPSNQSYHCFRQEVSESKRLNCLPLLHDTYIAGRDVQARAGGICINDKFQVSTQVISGENMLPQTPISLVSSLTTVVETPDKCYILSTGLDYKSENSDSATLEFDTSKQISNRRKTMCPLRLPANPIPVSKSKKMKSPCSPCKRFDTQWDTERHVKGAKQASCLINRYAVKQTQGFLNSKNLHDIVRKDCSRTKQYAVLTEKRCIGKLNNEHEPLTSGDADGEHVKRETTKHIIVHKEKMVKLERRSRDDEFTPYSQRKRCKVQKDRTQRCPVIRTKSHTNIRLSQSKTKNHRKTAQHSSVSKANSLSSVVLPCTAQNEADALGVSSGHQATSEEKTRCDQSLTPHLYRDELSLVETKTLSSRTYVIPPQDRKKGRQPFSASKRELTDVACQCNPSRKTQTTSPHQGNVNSAHTQCVVDSGTLFCEPPATLGTQTCYKQHWNASDLDDLLHLGEYINAYASLKSTRTIIDSQTHNASVQTDQAPALSSDEKNNLKSYHPHDTVKVRSEKRSVGDSKNREDGQESLRPCLDGDVEQCCKMTTLPKYSQINKNKETTERINQETVKMEINPNAIDKGETDGYLKEGLICCNSALTTGQTQNALLQQGRNVTRESASQWESPLRIEASRGNLLRHLHNKRMGEYSGIAETTTHSLLTHSREDDDFTNTVDETRTPFGLISWKNKNRRPNLCRMKYTRSAGNSPRHQAARLAQTFHKGGRFIKDFTSRFNATHVTRGNVVAECKNTVTKRPKVDQFREVFHKNSDTLSNYCEISEAVSSSNGPKPKYPSDNSAVLSLYEPPKGMTMFNLRPTMKSRLAVSETMSDTLLCSWSSTTATKQFPARAPKAAMKTSCTEYEARRGRKISHPPFNKLKHSAAKENTTVNQMAKSKPERHARNKQTSGYYIRHSSVANCSSNREDHSKIKLFDKRSPQLVESGVTLCSLQDSLIDLQNLAWLDLSTESSSWACCESQKIEPKFSGTSHEPVTTTDSSCVQTARLPVDRRHSSRDSLPKWNNKIRNLSLNGKGCKSGWTRSRRSSKRKMPSSKKIEVVSSMSAFLKHVPIKGLSKLLQITKDVAAKEYSFIDPLIYTEGELSTPTDRCSKHKKNVRSQRTKQENDSHTNKTSVGENSRTKKAVTHWSEVKEKKIPPKQRQRHETVSYKRDNTPVRCTCVPGERNTKKIYKGTPKTQNKEDDFNQDKFLVSQSSTCSRDSPKDGKSSFDHNLKSTCKQKRVDDDVLGASRLIQFTKGVEPHTNSLVPEVTVLGKEGGRLCLTDSPKDIEIVLGEDVPLHEFIGYFMNGLHSQHNNSSVSKETSHLTADLESQVRKIILDIFGVNSEMRQTKTDVSPKTTKMTGSKDCTTNMGDCSEERKLDGAINKSLGQYKKGSIQQTGFSVRGKCRYNDCVIADVRSENTLTAFLDGLGHGAARTPRSPASFGIPFDKSMSQETGETDVKKLGNVGSRGPCPSSPLTHIVEGKSKEKMRSKREIVVQMPQMIRHEKIKTMTISKPLNSTLEKVTKHLDRMSVQYKEDTVQKSSLSSHMWPSDREESMSPRVGSQSGEERSSLLSFTEKRKAAAQRGCIHLGTKGSFFSHRKYHQEKKHFSSPAKGEIKFLQRAPEVLDSGVKSHISYSMERKENCHGRAHKDSSHPHVGHSHPSHVKHTSSPCSKSAHQMRYPREAVTFADAIHPGRATDAHFASQGHVISSEPISTTVTGKSNSKSTRTTSESKAHRERNSSSYERGPKIDVLLPYSGHSKVSEKQALTAVSGTDTPGQAASRAPGDTDTKVGTKNTARATCRLANVDPQKSDGEESESLAQSNVTDDETQKLVKALMSFLSRKNRPPVVPTKDHGDYRQKKRYRHSSTAREQLDSTGPGQSTETRADVKTEAENPKMTAELNKEDVLKFIQEAVQSQLKSFGAVQEITACPALIASANKMSLHDKTEQTRGMKNTQTSSHAGSGDSDTTQQVSLEQDTSSWSEQMPKHQEPKVIIEHEEGTQTILSATSASNFPVKVKAHHLEKGSDKLPRPVDHVTVLNEHSEGQVTPTMDKIAMRAPLTVRTPDNSIRISMCKESKDGQDVKCVKLCLPHDGAQVPYEILVEPNSSHMELSPTVQAKHGFIHVTYEKEKEDPWRVDNNGISVTQQQDKDGQTEEEDNVPITENAMKKKKAESGIEEDSDKSLDTSEDSEDTSTSDTSSEETSESEERHKLGRRDRRGHNQGAEHITTSSGGDRSSRRRQGSPSVHRKHGAPGKSSCRSRHTATLRKRLDRERRRFENNDEQGVSESDSKRDSKGKRNTPFCSRHPSKHSQGVPSVVPRAKVSSQSDDDVSLSSSPSETTKSTISPDDFSSGDSETRGTSSTEAEFPKGHSQKRFISRATPASGARLSRRHTRRVPDDLGMKMEDVSVLKYDRGLRSQDVNPIKHISSLTGFQRKQGDRRSHFYNPEFTAPDAWLQNYDPKQSDYNAKALSIYNRTLPDNRVFQHSRHPSNYDRMTSDYDMIQYSKDSTDYEDRARPDDDDMILHPLFPPVSERKLQHHSAARIPQGLFNHAGEKSSTGRTTKIIKKDDKFDGARWQERDSPETRLQQHHVRKPHPTDRSLEDDNEESIIRRPYDSLVMSPESDPFYNQHVASTQRHEQPQESKRSFPQIVGVSSHDPHTPRSQQVSESSTSKNVHPSLLLSSKQGGPQSHRVESRFASKVKLPEHPDSDLGERRGQERVLLQAAPPPYAQETSAPGTVPQTSPSSTPSSKGILVPRDKRTGKAKDCKQSPRKVSFADTVDSDVPESNRSLQIDLSLVKPLTQTGNRKWTRTSSRNTLPSPRLSLSPRLSPGTPHTRNGEAMPSSQRLPAKLYFRSASSMTRARTLPSSPASRRDTLARDSLARSPLSRHDSGYSTPSWRSASFLSGLFRPRPLTSGRHSSKTRPSRSPQDGQRDKQLPPQQHDGDVTPQQATPQTDEFTCSDWDKTVQTRLQQRSVATPGSGVTSSGENLLPVQLNSRW